MKKVLLLVTKSNLGGAQRYVYDLATSIPKESYKVTVVAGGDGILFKKLHDKHIRTTSIPHMGRDISIGEEIKSLLKLFKIIHRENPDIVHVNSPKISGLTAVASRLLGVKKIVYTVHGWSFNESRPNWQILLIKFFSWLTLFLVTDTIVLSRKERNQVIHWPLIKKKVTIIPNGINPPDFFSPEEAREFIYKQADLGPDNKKVIISIGELTPNKDYLTALRAVETLSFPYHYFILGEGEDRPALEQYIEAHNLQNNVHLLGFTPDAARYLRGADIFLLSSQKEGLPYVIAEAMAAGLPIVATSVGGIPEYLEGTVPPHNPAAILEGLENLGNSGINPSPTHYPQLEEQVEKTLAIYR